LKTFKKGGITLNDNKLSASSAIKKLAIPEIAYIPLQQHLGAPAIPTVNINDKVKAGQLIAKAQGTFSANIHSSVSGTVIDIREIKDTSGQLNKSFIIHTEGDEWLENIDSSTTLKKEITLSSEEIISKVIEAGIVGMGGATFPSHVKLTIPDGKTADVLIINGVECEPYLTADHRLMLEKGHEILVGIQIMKKALGVEKAMIGIENNKPDAIEYLQKNSKEYSGIDVVALKPKYPQGGEKQLIKALINREVPSGGLPIDVGAIVHNVGTVFAVYEAVQKDKPLFERIVTVSGKSLRNPSNFLVRIGTPVSELINATGGLPGDTGKIINGGPMMGKEINDIEIPVIKGTTGILILPKSEIKNLKTINCIRCAKCVDACPMGFEPYMLALLSENSNFKRIEKEIIMDCIECNSCAYICPSGRPVLDLIRQGKMKVKEIKTKSNN